MGLEAFMASAVKRPGRPVLDWIRGLRASFDWIEGLHSVAIESLKGQYWMGLEAFLASAEKKRPGRPALDWIGGLKASATEASRASIKWYWRTEGQY